MPHSALLGRSLTQATCTERCEGEGVKSQTIATDALQGSAHNKGTQAQNAEQEHVAHFQPERSMFRF